MRRWLALLVAVVALPPLAATPPKLPHAPAGAVQGRFVLPDRPVWAGEVFDLGLDWQVDWSLFRNFDGDMAWKPDPLVADVWSKPALDHPAPVAGRDRATLHVATRAMALAPGRLALAPVRQPMAIVTGGYVTDGVSISTMGTVLAESAAATLVVRPLPPPPPDYGGAVGQFVLTSRLDKVRAATGDPIRWTLTLAGTGNWASFPGLPARQLDRAFDVAGKPRIDEGKDPALFERMLRETVTIVPRQPGRFTLGPVDLVTFDPAQGRYVTISAPAIEVEVRPGPGMRLPKYEAEPPPAAETEPLPPSLQGVGQARVPMGKASFALLLALPFVAVAALWLFLALHHALRADPDRQARAARRRLARTLAALDGTDREDERRALVRAWQRDTGLEWKLDRAVPIPASFAAPDWRRAWSEADAYLYGPDADLPGDWLDRARALQAEKAPPPPFAARTILELRHLYPVAALVCVLLAVQIAPLAAAPASGSLEQRVARHPLDWIARYDLARRAAIAHRWQRAATQAGIAFVQQPRDPATRALWLRSAREAGLGGAADGGLPQLDGPAERLAALTGPAGWQTAALVAALALAGGGAILILVRFGRVGRRVRPAGIVLILAGGLAGGGAAVALHGYGLAASPQAGLTWQETPLRALPVDTPDDEAPTRLAPGILAVPDAHFLGWAHVRLGDGRTGWLRDDRLLSLWRAAP